MTDARLFVDTPLAAGETLTLTGEQANYAGRVLRCRVGSVLTLFDGSGHEVTATVTAVSRRSIAVELGSATTPAVESRLDLRLIQGVSKGDRMDTVVQKATELGVRQITPLLSEFSVVKLDEARAEKKRLHWQGVARSACEQCGRTRLPVIDPVLRSDELFGADTADDIRRIALLPGADQSFASLPLPTAGIELLIGPEGGFSERECERIAAAGYVGVSLGPRVLRTETAAIAALTLAQSLWGDMRID